MSVVANPILPGCYPDPSVVQVGDEYFLVTSTFEYFPGLPVFRSTDLVSWEQLGHVIDREGQLDLDGIASSGGLFAPTIRHHDGVFWVVCTLVRRPGEESGSPSGNFVVTATDPAGPWSDPVWLDVAGIDPSLFFDDDGRIWVHGTRLAAEPEWHDQTQVWLRELDPETMALTGPERILWTGALRGAVWAEGPHLYKVDGAYYLLAAEAGTSHEHAVCVARAEAVTGPYVGHKANPVLTHRHLGHGETVVGPGHADLVQGPDGSWWALLLAMRTYGGYHYNLGRETFLVPVTWEEGWPVFAPGAGRVPDVVEVPFANAETSALVGPPQQVTAGVIGPGDVRWTSLRRPATTFATPSGDGWDLRVQPLTLADPLTPSFLGVRQQHQDCDFAVHLGLTGLGPDDSAGLAVRQSEKAHVTLTAARANADQSDDRDLVVRAVHVRDGGATVLAETTVAASDWLTLRVEVRQQDYALVVDGDEPHVLATADGRTLDSAAAGGFLGLWLGVYATSNGTPTTSTLTVRAEYAPRSGATAG